MTTQLTPCNVNCSLGQGPLPLYRSLGRATVAHTVNFAVKNRGSSSKHLHSLLLSLASEQSSAHHCPKAVSALCPWPHHFHLKSSINAKETLSGVTFNSSFHNSCPSTIVCGSISPHLFPPHVETVHFSPTPYLFYFTLYAPKLFYFLFCPIRATLEYKSIYCALTWCGCFVTSMAILPWNYGAHSEQSHNLWVSSFCLATWNLLFLFQREVWVLTAKQTKPAILVLSLCSRRTGGGASKVQASVKISEVNISCLTNEVKCIKI